MEKYFTPSIEDIRIGYEYEELTFNPQDDISVSPPIWEKRTFPDPFTGGDVTKLKNRNIRVKYLSQEQIEAEGFIFYKMFDTILEFLWKDSISVRYNTKTKKLGVGEGLFYGNCPSINEFRIIIKLIGI